MAGQFWSSVANDRPRGGQKTRIFLGIFFERKWGLGGRPVYILAMKYLVSDLGEDLSERLHGRDLIVFDGVCVLCSGFIQFMLRHDREARFSFAMAQAELGQALYAALGMPLDEFQTNLVIKEGWIYTDLDAFAAAMGALPWPWKVLGVARVLPQLIKVPLYRVVARNRYRIFGRYDACLVPADAVRARFLPGGMV